MLRGFVVFGPLFPCWSTIRAILWDGDLLRSQLGLSIGSCLVLRYRGRIW